MKYPPKHYQENNINHLITVIKTYPLATLISVENNMPLITHLPLIYNKKGKLIGHIDKNNPQAKLLKDQIPINVIFSGPDCYISPNVCKSSELPTWNYIKVHLKGQVSAINSTETLKQSLVDLTTFMEHPEHQFKLDINHPKMHSLIHYIQGFEIDITHWEGKFKLSRDKNITDMSHAKEELIRVHQTSIRSFLDSIFSP